MTVWHYALTGPDVLLSMPEGAKVLRVDFQRRAPYGLCLWVLVDPDAEKALDHFITTPTGGDVPENAQHVGTAQSPEGLVWHVWRPA